MKFNKITSLPEHEESINLTHKHRLIILGPIEATWRVSYLWQLCLGSDSCVCLCCKCGSDGMDGGESGICLMCVFVLCSVNWPSHTRLYLALPITFSQSGLHRSCAISKLHYTFLFKKMSGLAVSMLNCDSHVGNVNLSLAPSLPVLYIKPAVSLFVF